MSRARIYFRNILANWFGFGANLAAMFFLTPYVFRSLGESTYGVWSIVMTLTGYMGLAEIGTRAGLGRFINYYMGRGEPDNVNRVINTALIIFAVCSALVLLLATLMGGFFESVFNVDQRFADPVRIALMLTALSLVMSFFSAAFNQILIALDRYDILNGIMLAVLTVRIAGTVWVISISQPDAHFPHVAGGLRFTGPFEAMGREWLIAGLAGVQLFNAATSLAVAFLIARRVWPSLRIAPALGSMRRFWELFGFSIWAFIGNIAIQLLTWTDTLVIGVVFEPGMVAYYSIGSMLVVYSNTLIAKSVSVLGPQLFKDCARRDFDSVRMLFGYGNTLAMFVGVPLLTGLIMFGREFLTLWMGDGYDFDLSYRIMFILAVSNYFAFMAAMSGTIYSGLNRPRLLAGLMIAQGAANLALTLVLVLWLRMGVEGVALGTLFPCAIFSLLTVYIALRWIGMPPKRFLATQIGRWAMGVGVFATTGYALNAVVPQNGWLWFVVKASISIVAYGALSWIFLLRRDERQCCMSIIT